MSDKKESARDAITAYSTKHFEIDHSKVSHLKKSEGMLRWYIEEVFNRTEGRQLTEDDVEEAILDGSGDLGGDLYHRTSEGEVLIIQAKFHGSGKTEPTEDINYFAGLLDRLRDPQAQKRAKKKLREFIADIDWKTDRFDLRYIALSRIENQSADQVSALSTKWNNDATLNVNLQYLSETDLNLSYRNAISLLNGLPSNQVFHVAKGTVVIEIPGTASSCVMIVPGKEITQLYAHARDSLFSTNIRSYLGDTKINKEIKGTIADNPEDFYYYNNGITCLCSQLEIANRQITVSGLQVINGAQTVRALAKAEKAKPGATDNVLVLVRVTVREQSYGAKGRFIENIVRYNNSQNAMKPADFISNDPIQGWLHKEFNKSKRNGNEVIYLNKRAASESSGKEMIPIDDFAKSIYSFFFDPIKFATGSTFFFTPGKDKGYYRVFGNGEELFEPPMEVSEFKVRSAVWWISKEFGLAMKNDKKTNKYGAALERKHFVLFAARLILERNFGEDYKAVLAKHYQGNWRIKDTEGFGPFFKRLYELSRDSVVYIFKKDEQEQEDGFNQRNWMRSSKTQEAIQTYCENAPGLDGLAEPLPSK